MTTFTVSPISTFPNSLITINVVSPNYDGKIKFSIACPNETTYVIEGTIINGTAEILTIVNSGEGEYIITPVDHCEPVVPASLAVHATCCKPTINGQHQLTITAPTSKIIGQAFTVVITGGIPNKVVTVVFGMNVVTLTLNNTGSGSVYLQGTQAGADNIIAVQENSITAIHSITIIPSINAVPITPNPPPACTYPLTMVSKLSRGNIPTGTNATLTITVCNENSGALNYTLPEITLPTGLSSPSPIKLTNEPIPAYTCREFNFVISGVNTAAVAETIAIAFPPHTYVCQGETYTVASSNTSVLVLPAAQSCGLEVTVFTASPTMVTSGSKTTLTLTVLNQGTGAVTQLTLHPINLPSALGGGTIDFNNVSLAGGASYTYTKEVTTTNTTGAPLSAVVYIPIGRLSCICEGELLVDDVPHTVSVLVNP